MATDIYAALMGEAPTDQESVAALAAQLRKRQSYGQLGQLTGDRVLAPLGAGMAKNADAYVSQLQETRQADRRAKQVKEYQDWQQDYGDKSLSQRDSEARMGDSTTRRGQDMSLLGDQIRAEAAARAAQTRLSKPLKMTGSEQTTLSNAAGMAANLNKLSSEFKDEYAAPQVGGQSIPGARPLANYMARHGVGSKDMKSAQKWWAESKRLYDMITRHEIYGSALTGYEIGQWDQANTNQDMDPKQLKDMLASIQTKVQQTLAQREGFFREGNYDQGQVDALVRPAHQGGGATAGYAPQAAVPAQGGGFSDPEKEARYQAWKRAQGR